MKLKELLKGLPVKIHGLKNIGISGICSHSKRIAPGNLFVAKRGSLFDGNLYTQEAISSGAVAILTDLFDPNLKQITQIVCDEVPRVEAQIAARYYRYPSRDLRVIGVTGTNGKTTSSYLIKHVLDKKNLPCGLIGTIDYLAGSHRYEPTHTTPDPSTIQKLLREMVHQSCEAVVMEASSHGLSQCRLEATEFDIALFTNLSQDHLDYHESMEAYLQAKQILFRSLTHQVAIVNIDSNWTQKVLEGCSLPRLAYGLSQEADLRSENFQFNSLETQMDVIWEGKKHPCRVPIIGRFNLYNTLGALAVAISCGIDLKEAISTLESFPGIPGRMERVPNESGIEIYVDFAHTPNALESALKALRETSEYRTITVFGCGGDRDREKRKEMATIAEKYSDVVIVTNDNPRTEDPEQIADEIYQGFSNPSRPVRCLDRREAIERAILEAKQGDRVLIAGKGHEKYQIFTHNTVAFDDVQVAKEVFSSCS